MVWRCAGLLWTNVETRMHCAGLVLVVTEVIGGYVEAGVRIQMGLQWTPEIDQKLQIYRYMW